MLDRTKGMTKMGSLTRRSFRAYSKSEVPAGIDLSESPLVKEYGLYEGSCVLGLSAYSQHPEEVIRFLEYLGTGEKEKK